MKHRNMKSTLCQAYVIICAIGLSSLLAGAVSAPISTSKKISTSATKEQLFTLGRSTDPNEIIYEASLCQQFQFDVKNPLNVYWLLHTENERTKPLTWPQRKFGFGLKVSSATHSEIICHFAAFSKRTLSVRNHHGKMKAFIMSNGREMILNRVFLQVEGGSFWVPNITQVTLYLSDPASGQKQQEHLTP